MFFDHLLKNALICAHHGVRSIAPENTLLAMKKAKECGAHCWETDVRVSKDDELVIFHDATLERTTDIAIHKMFRNREHYRLDHFTARELRPLDAGSWFLTDDPFDTVDSGEVVDRKGDLIREQQNSLLSRESGNKRS
jgi:glycerophosphoryl diester phosphodiesterase